LLSEKGVHNTPMSAVAKNAGTGMGTIYNYFPNKNELINALYLFIKGEEKLAFEPFDPKQPIKTQFEKYFSDFILFFAQNPNYFSIIEQLKASPIITPESKAEGSKSIKPFLDLIEHGQKHRIIKNIDSYELLVFVGGVVSAYLHGYFNQNKKPIVLTNQIQLAWDAIKE